MTKTATTEEVIPSAKRLINSLRSLGYEFPTAVAELVDNAIEAEATEITIRVEFDGENSWVMIANNGKGMTEDQLKEAMRFGSEREYNEKSLGKFGLGLKTASFSQCTFWSVATRVNPEQPEIIAFRWDLDHVNRNDKWEIIPLKNKDLDIPVLDYLNEHTGTVILWKKLDRILEYKYPNSEHARKRFSGMCRDLEDHLAMVFHRFIHGEITGNKLIIILNGNEIRHWDPFVRSEKGTKELEVIRIPLEHEGVHGEIVIEPYILPPKTTFSSPQEHARAAGPKKWNQQQGFYIYRNDRMIQSGGWCRIRTYDEHTKLARFALNFSSKLDGSFKIDVSKMYVQIPAQIRKDIEEKIQPLVARAREIYDQAEKSSPVIPVSPPIHPDTSVRPHQVSPPADTSDVPKQRITVPVVYPDNHEGKKSGDEYLKFTSGPAINPEKNLVVNKLWTLDEIFQELKNTAEPSEIPVLERIFSRLRENFDKI